MVPPWIGYSIWKFWVIHVLVCLVFQVFSGAELISLAKTVKLAVWAFSSNFLYDFTLFVIDMHQNMPISLFKTLFDHFHFVPPTGIIWRVLLKLCHTDCLCLFWFLILIFWFWNRNGRDGGTNWCFGPIPIVYGYSSLHLFISIIITVIIIIIIAVLHHHRHSA